MEYAYSLMAKSCGIVMTDTRLFSGAGKGPPYFATKRFDRLGADERVHLHTASGLLHASHRLPTLDYKALIELAYTLTQDQRAAAQMFRRMVFNVLAHNRDDHGKQFSFLMASNGEMESRPCL